MRNAVRHRYGRVRRVRVGPERLLAGRLVRVGVARLTPLELLARLFRMRVFTLRSALRIGVRRVPMLLDLRCEVRVGVDRTPVRCEFPERTLCVCVRRSLIACNAERIGPCRVLCRTVLCDERLEGRC